MRRQLSDGGGMRERGPLQRFTKRAFDLLGGTVLAVVTAPISAIVAGLILITDGRPVLFKQERVGKGGRKFDIWKFRTMTTSAPEGSAITHGSRDPRITRVGGFLRKSKFDELPQLYNVIKGEMSLVGPRAEVEEYTRLYDERQRQVLAVRPGCVDITHIRGHRHDQDWLDDVQDPKRHYREVVMPRKLEFNLEYLEKQSLLLDLKILGGTALGLLGDLGRSAVGRRRDQRGGSAPR